MVGGAAVPTLIGTIIESALSPAKLPAFTATSYSILLVTGVPVIEKVFAFLLYVAVNPELFNTPLLIESVLNTVLSRALFGSKNMPSGLVKS